MKVALRLALPFTLMLAIASGAEAQLIPVKTSPIATGNQFDFLPSDNRDAGGLAIALPDTMRDPFENPALGARIRQRTYFGAPSLYSLSSGAGTGATLPVGVVARTALLFGGAAFAVQTISPTGPPSGPIEAPNVPDVLTLTASDTPGLLETPVNRDATNRYFAAFGGIRLRDSSVSLGVSVSGSELNGLDGSDLLFANGVTTGLSQHGGTFDARLGVAKLWRGGATLSASLTSDRFYLTQDAHSITNTWDPNRQIIVSTPHDEQNAAVRQTFGGGVNLQVPIDSVWRVGASLVANRITHPLIPASGSVDLAGDPTRSSAFDIGVGAARATAATRAGVEAVYEPIWSRGYYGATDTDDRVRFSNWIVRGGFEHTFPQTPPPRALTMRVGLSARAVSYQVASADSATRGSEHWTEWTPSVGMSVHMNGPMLNLDWLRTSGLGRPASAGAPITPTPLGATPVLPFGATSTIGSPSLLMAPVAATILQVSLMVPVP